MSLFVNASFNNYAYSLLRRQLNNEFTRTEFYQNRANPRCCIFISPRTFTYRWFFSIAVMLFFVWFLPLSFYGALSSCKMCFLRRACYAARNITFCPRCSDGHYSSALMHITNDEDWKNKTAKLRKVGEFELAKTSVYRVHLY